jgi:hypothetical protein
VASLAQKLKAKTKGAAFEAAPLQIRLLLIAYCCFQEADDRRPPADGSS